MLRHPAICVFIVAFLIPSAAYSQTGQSISVPPDSPRWDLQEAKVTEYQGRKCLLLDGQKIIDAANASHIAIVAQGTG